MTCCSPESCEWFRPGDRRLFTLLPFQLLGSGSQEVAQGALLRTEKAGSDAWIIVASFCGSATAERHRGTAERIAVKAVTLARRTGNPVIVGRQVGVNKGSLPIFQSVGRVVTLKSDPLSVEAFDSWVNDLVANIGRVSRADLASLGAEAMEHLAINYSGASATQLARALDGYSSTIAGPSGRMMAAQRIEITKTLRNVLTQAGARAARMPQVRAGLASGFSIRDREVSALLSRHHSFWVRDRHGAISQSMSARARGIISSGVDRGLGQREIGRELSAMTGTGLRQPHYYRTVAANHVSRARSYSIGATFRAAGITMFRIEAVLDDRTCFAAGTKVRMADGSKLPIERIRPGDQIYSCRGRARRVMSLKVHQKRAWIVMRLATGATVRVTPNHPMLTESGWVKAGLLCAGDRLVEYRGQGSHGDVQKLWCDVPADAATQSVLFRELQGTGTDVQMVRQDVPCSEDLSRPRSRDLLLSSMQESIEAGRIARGQDTGNLRDMRRDISVSPIISEARHHEASLLEVVRTKDPGIAVQNVRRGLSATGGQAEVLLDVVLSKAHRGNEHRNDSPSEAGMGWNPVRAGEADRSLVGRLPGRGPDCAGGRRTVLACRPENTGEGCEARCRACEEGVRCTPNRRGRSEPRPGLRAACIDSLWPRPRKDLGQTARLVRIVELHGEISAEPELAYDIEVEEDAGYIAQGVVVHNTHQCSFLHGKVLPVGASVARIERIMNDPNPESMLVNQPFIQDHGNELTIAAPGQEPQRVATITERSSGASPSGVSAQFSNAMSGSEMVDAAIGMPPYHHGCRTTVISIIV